MIDQPDLYMKTYICKDLEELRDTLNLWSLDNKEHVFMSHSVTVLGMQYLLTIVYHWVQD